MIVNLPERKREVLKILSEDWGTSISDISSRLNVSTVTIRSDLDALAEEGFIVRTRGGALPAFHQTIYNRQKTRVLEKTLIAQTAANLIEDGDHIMIVAGTTTAAIARYLLGIRDLHIVTNSTLLLPYARINPSLHLTLVGGQFCPSAEAMTGPIALRELEQFHVKTAFLGTDGFSPKSGITANLLEVAEVVRKVATQAENRILVADSSKYGRAGFAHILPLNSITSLITDDGIDPENVVLLEKMGISVKIARKE
jgi:DeoR/GlpR family transcriptional regulator of sugar metabolism